MAVIPVLKAGDPILRKKSEPVKKIDKRIIKLLKHMADTMYFSEGVGLAAPQVGINERIVVIDVGDGLIELINPEIISSEGVQLCTQEGCLSVPGLFGKVERAMKVEVKALDRNGEEFTFEAEGFKAQAVQHEIDHLDGILFIDKAQSIYKAEQLTQEE